MNTKATWTCSTCGAKVAATVPPKNCENEVDEKPCDGAVWTLDDRPAADEK